jgi:membrane protease YdiL (CAAX protease family)
MRIQALASHATLTYFVLAFVLTWAFWIPMIFTAPGSAPFFLLWDVGNVFPSLVGILLTALFTGKRGLRDLWRRVARVDVPLRWYAVALLLAPLLQLAAAGVPAALGLVTVTFAWTVWNGIGALFMAAIGEELGWRGFALPRMQAHRQALAASLLLGVIWGLWHLPLKIATGLDAAGYIGFVVGAVAHTVLFTWVYNNTRGSLFLMILFHTSIDIIFVFPSSTSIVAVLYGILLWTTVAVVVVVEGPARLARSLDVAQRAGSGSARSS